MSHHNLIPFDPANRVLKKAAGYVEDVERFLKAPRQALPTLKKALLHADDNFKNQIILLLGGTADLEVIHLLYQLMADPEETEEIRQFASIQIAITAPLMEKLDDILEILIRALKSREPVLRANAALALGWEGNVSAVLPLIQLLYDSDSDVQQSAVNALSNMQDDRLLGLLVDRLHQATLDQKRSILHNLWRFTQRRKEVLEIYEKMIIKGDPQLRLDALRLLDMVAAEGEAKPVYKWCLADGDPAIRSLAREKLNQVPSQ